MAKISFGNILSGYMTASALNNNFSDIADEFQTKVLYRDNPEGEPNHMLVNIDMNSNRILNLPNAETSSEPVTLGQLMALLNQ